jgi:hypothetical protein
MTDKIQIKFSIESEIVSEFKSQCSSKGVSMTSEIRQFMKACRSTRDTKIKIQTRPQRRKAVRKIIALLNDIMVIESQYCENIPEQFAQKQEEAEYACEYLSDAIASLEEAFS